LDFFNPVIPSSAAPVGDGTVLLKRLERLWRSFGFGLFLSIIGIGGSLLAVTVFPLIVLVVRDPLARQRRIQSVIRAAFKIYPDYA